MGANTIRHDIHNSSFNKAAACWQNHEFLTFFMKIEQNLYVFVCVTSEIGLGSIYHLQKSVGILNVTLKNKQSSKLLYVNNIFVRGCT